MTRKKKPEVPVRDGKPTSCVSCGKPLHRKSEYYCSEACGRAYRERVGKKAPPFLSKWKVRKRKEIKDPLILLRKKVRRKTNDLIRRGYCAEDAAWSVVVAMSFRITKTTRILYRSFGFVKTITSNTMKASSRSSMENCVGIRKD